MKNNYLSLKAIFFGTLLMLAYGCQDDVAIEGIINVEDEYDLYITQTLDENGSSAAIKVKSIKDQQCANAFLSYSSNTTQDLVELFLNKFHIEGQCIEETHYVEETIPMNLNSESRPIKINIAGAIKNEGEIIVDEESFELEMKSNNGFKISQAKINRIQNNFKWGTYYSSNPETIDEISFYLQSINNGQPVKNGNYGLFNLGQNGEITLDDESVFTPFAFYSNENFDDLKNRILEINASDNSLIFQVTNYDGRSLNIQ